MAKILVLDDRESDRELMRLVLGSAGHETICVERSEEALDLIRLHRPDLVIADIVMPGMDGYELVRRIREDPGIAATRVALCSASYQESEAGGLARRHGVERVLAKPWDPRRLRAEVASLLASEPAAVAEPPAQDEFDREHLSLINAKLVEKVEELELANRERGRLLGQLVRAQDEERNRIADDIHDDPIQALAAAALHLDLLERRLPLPELVERLRQAREAVRGAAARLREMLFDLRPPALDEQGVAGALELYMRQIGGAELEWGVRSELASEPEPDVRTVLYRVGREALTNARKHARASRTEVRLRALDGGVELAVSDDGIGFDPAAREGGEPGGFGLASMAERVRAAGGWLRVESAPGGGTAVICWLPLRAATEPPGGGPAGGNGGGSAGWA